MLITKFLFQIYLPGFSIVRNFFSKIDLGIVNFVRIKHKIQQSSLDNQFEFTEMLTKNLSTNNYTMDGLTQNLIKLVYVMDGTPNEIELMKQMLSIYSKRNNELGDDLKYHFGPVIMRMFHNLQLYNEAKEVSNSTIE